MKKLVLQLSDSAASPQARAALSVLSGVMVTNIHRDRMTIHYGERFRADQIIRQLRDCGCAVAEQQSH